MGVGSTAAASSTALASEGGLERWSSTKVVRTLALARTAAGTTAATIAAATEALVLARSPEVSSGTAEVSPETTAIAGLPQPLGLLLQMHHAAHAFVLHALAFTPSAQRSSRLMLRSFGTHLNGVVAVDALGGAASSAEALLNAAVAFVAIVLEEIFGSKGGSSAGGGKAGSCTGTAVPFRAGEGGDGDGAEHLLSRKKIQTRPKSDHPDTQTYLGVLRHIHAGLRPPLPAPRVPTVPEHPYGQSLQGAAPGMPADPPRATRTRAMPA